MELYDLDEESINLFHRIFFSEDQDYVEIFNKIDLRSKGYFTILDFTKVMN